MYTIGSYKMSLRNLNYCQRAIGSPSRFFFLALGFRVFGGHIWNDHIIFPYIGILFIIKWGIVIITPRNQIWTETDIGNRGLPIINQDITLVWYQFGQQSILKANRTYFRKWECVFFSMNVFLWDNNWYFLFTQMFVLW